MVIVAPASTAPADPIAQLADRARQSNDACLDRVDAAVLIADVSGFTALTAALQAAHGARGADMLSAIMDRLLGGLGEIAERNGGRVVDIVGDAIHVLWIAEDADGLAAARQDAITAADAMLDHAAANSNSEHVTPVRIGIATGSVDLAMVGGHAGRWELLTFGPALADANSACAKAPKSSCRVHGGKELEADAGTGNLERLADGGWLLRRRAAQTGTEPGLLDRASAEILSWTAELRLVTVMFCRLVRSEDMAAATLERIQALTRAMQDVIAAHGGMVDRVHADDKGISAVIAFGMRGGSFPGVKLETVLGGGSPLHAVLAGLGVRQALAEHDASCAIGIATGKVRVGVDDLANGSCHTMYGNAVNLAARCMQASDDEILCDEATRVEASEAVDFASAGSRSFKGLDKAGPIYCALAVRNETSAPISSDASIIAGRANECGAISAFLENWTSADARVLLLEGAHGSGKSRLAGFALGEAERSEVRALLCRCGLLGTRTPLFAWRESMASLLRRRAEARGLSLTQLLADLTTQAGGDARDLPLLGSLFGYDLAGGTADDVEADPAAARRLRAAVAAALLGDRRRLIVFEDAHWLDDVSMTLARDLLRALPKLQILFAARVPAPPALLKADRQTRHVRIGDLDRAATADLAASLLGPFDSKHPFVDWLHERSAGNPMFCRSLIALLPKDVMATSLTAPGAWRKAREAIERTDMPATIEGALLARIGNLPPTQTGLLKAASVLGGDFNPQMLIDLGTPSTAPQIELDLQALVEAGILSKVGEDDDAKWLFSDELTRKVIYDSLPQQLLRELHRRAAGQSEGNTGLGIGAAQIAHHWLQAGMPARAFSPLRRAGIEARQAGAYASAVSLWKTALNLLESGQLGKGRAGKARRAILHRDLALVSWRLGEPQATIDHCYASLAGLWRGAPQTAIGWSAMLARQIAGLGWQIVRPGLFRRRRSRLHRVQDWLRINNGVRLIEAFYFSKGALPAAAIATYAARIAERTGETAYAARPYGFLGYLAGSKGWPRVAQFCFARPRKDCLRKRDWASLGQSIHGETMYLLTQGEWRGAIDRALFGRTLSRKINKGADTGSLTTLIGLAHLMAGDFAAMREAFERVEAIAYAKSNDHYLLFAREAQGQIELAAGSPARAESLLIGARGLAKEVRDLQSALIAEALHANALLRLDRIDEAEAMMAALLDRAEATPMVNFGTWYGFGALSEAAIGIYAARGAGDNLVHKTSATRAMTLLNRFARSYPVAVPRARLLGGQLHSLNGDHKTAALRWQRGLRVAEARDMRHDLARLHAALGESPLSDSAERSRHLSTAERLALACGVASLPPFPLSLAA